MSTLPSTTPRSTPVASTFTGSFNLGRIGVLIDRWANLFPGMANQVPEAQAYLLLELNERKLPVASIQTVKAHAGLMSQVTSMVSGGYERPYVVIQTDPGVVCALYIASYGNDLYASWRTHVRGVLNRRLFLLLAAAAAVPSLCISPCLLLFGTIQQGFSLFGGGSQTNLMTSIAPILFIFAGLFVTGLFLLAFAGYFLQGNILYYFFVEPDIFDAEDVTALSMAAHQSLVNAVNKIGIDITKIEPKKFNSGRRSERL